MKKSNFALCLLALLFGTLMISHPILAQPGARPNKTSANAEVVESGKFHFLDTKQPAGEESYEIIREGAVLTLRSRLEMEVEEEKAVLTATLVMRPDLTPERFEIKGKKRSGSDIDLRVEVRAGAATVTENGAARQTTVPIRFFTAGGYAPIAIEMMILRYWTRNQVKGPLKILPGGEVTIQNRGRDMVTVSGKQVQLERYNLVGLTWGAQTLWLDAEGKLVAVVGIGGDMESTLPVVRDGFQAQTTCRRCLPFNRIFRRASQEEWKR